MKPHIQALINTITTKIFDLSFGKPTQQDIDRLADWVEILKAQGVESNVAKQLNEWIQLLKKTEQPKPIIKSIVHQAPPFG